MGIACFGTKYRIEMKTKQEEKLTSSTPVISVMGRKTDDMIAASTMSLQIMISASASAHSGQSFVYIFNLTWRKLECFQFLEHQRNLKFYRCVFWHSPLAC